MIDAHFLGWLRTPEVQSSVWIGVGGSMLVLFQSILSGNRRSWHKLILSCVIGGLASALTGHAFSDSSFVLFYCGVAAVVAENVIFGLFNASEEFKNNPINVFAQLYRIVGPGFGLNTDKAGLDRPSGKGSDTSDEAVG